MDESSARTGGGLAGDDDLVERLRAGDESALAALFHRHRERLWRMVQFRLDRRLAARLDSDDILQEAFVSATSRVNSFLSRPDGSAFVWLRLVVGQTMVDVYRRHLGAEMRDAGRDVSVCGSTNSTATSAALAEQFLSAITSPSHAAMKAELSQQLEEAISALSAIDQEIIALRHFEDLTNAEAAEVLGLQPTAASNRYVRAIARLKDVLIRIPGFFE